MANMKDVFEKIAKRENAKLFIKDQIVSMGMGVRSPNCLYSILLEYKGVKIVLDNEVGTTSIGTITCQFPFDIDVPLFELKPALCISKSIACLNACNSSRELYFSS
jgi:hypothetical protein